MDKTFSIQNMETYFRNYVPCREHNRQPITNFCTERICLKFMCPQCVQIHSLTHANHPIQSIRTCIRKSSSQIKKTIKQLQHEANKYNLLKYQTPEQMDRQLIRELHKFKQSLIDEINQYFKQKQAQVKRHTEKWSQIKNRVIDIQKQLHKALQQLQILDKNLYVRQQCVNAIKKANKIDYHSLIAHFKQKILQMEKNLDFNMKIQLNPAKRQQFKRVLNHLITYKTNKALDKNRMGNASRTQFQIYRPQNQISQNLQKSLYNAPPLSADRLLNQAAFKINYQNYFQSEPFVHFFQLSKPNLHILKIKQIKQGQSPKWNIINLNISFAIPSFHRTLATQSGSIYLIGGTNINTLQKSKAIYQFDSIQNTLRQVAELNVGRSSHSMVCLNKMIYIVGGMTENDQIPKKCEIFNSRTNECKLISPCKYATMNSTLCSLGKDNLIKLGGVDFQGKNSDYIEIYNIASDFWGQIDPTIQQVKGQFGLLSCSGWATLNQDQVFIFGGYNEQADNQNSKMSYVFEYKRQNKQFYIKYINVKNLPVAEGFWNPQAVLHNGIIYALQNMDAQAQTECLEDKRNLLIFNGKYWATFHNNQ